MKKKTKIVLGISIPTIVLAIAVLLGLFFTGLNIGWGPFSFAFWGQEVNRINSAYKKEENQNIIEFYGQSNFRLWTQMDEDLSQYKVINAGFGGSTDKLMVEKAQDLLYDYHPQIVVFQTGSNDYVSMEGSDEEKIEQCMEYKKYMYSLFHTTLPNAKFIVMSGLLLPGRSEYTPMTIRINEELDKLCSQYDYMSYVCANEMTYDGTTFRSDLFREDGIHLNHQGELLWRDDYIVPALEKVIVDNSIQGVRKE